MENDKRRAKYIDRRVQGQLAMRTLLHWVTLMLVCCIVSLALQFLLNPLASGQENFANMWAAQGPIILVAFALFPLFVSDTIRYSHRFVGPITRVRSVLRALAAGESPARIQLRPGDHWGEIAEEINLLITEMERLKGLAKAEQKGLHPAPLQSAAVLPETVVTG